MYFEVYFIAYTWKYLTTIPSNVLYLWPESGNTLSPSAGPFEVKKKDPIFACVSTCTCTTCTRQTKQSISCTLYGLFIQCTASEQKWRRAYILTRGTLGKILVRSTTQGYFGWLPFLCTNQILSTKKIFEPPPPSSGGRARPYNLIRLYRDRVISDLEFGAVTS